MLDLDFITPKEAATRADVTRRCITKWLARHPTLGVRVMGRWRVRLDVFNLILEGQTPPLGTVAHHDRTH
jgi:hypothetical protein